MALRIPGRYRLVKVLGRGGMGTVVLAEDLRLRRPVALKLVRRELEALPTTTERFFREARAMAAVEHPNLVRLLDLDLEHSPPFLVMEVVDGWTLEELLDETRSGYGRPIRRLTGAEVLALGRELGSALTCLHAEGLIHRDLKPSNVMLRRDGGAAVLMDLGLVRGEEATALTETGALVGSPAFLPPEVVRGRDWGPAGDQFQLAALLRLALSGVSHVEASDLAECLGQVQEGRFRASLRPRR